MLRFVVPLFICVLFIIRAAAQTPGIDHFSWTMSPSVAEVGRPVAIAIEARDVGEQPVTNFNGAAALFASTRDRPPSVLITEVGIANPRFIELGNVSDSPVSVGGWVITLYDTNTWPRPRTAFTIPPG